MYQAFVFILSILGDVNGDGRISASDVTYLRQIASDNALYESLSVEKKLASMVINKGNVTSADAEIVKNVINKMFGKVRQASFFDKPHTKREDLDKSIDKIRAKYGQTIVKSGIVAKHEELCDGLIDKEFQPFKK